MRHGIKSTLLLVMILGFVAVIGHSTLAQEAPAPKKPRPPIVLSRAAASIWTYQTETKDEITEETPLEDGKTGVAKYKLNTNSTSRIYFKDQGQDKLWNILFLTKHDKKELLNYDENGKDVTADKKAYAEMVGGPWGMLAKTGPVGDMTTTAADTLTEKEWEEAVLSHLRTFPAGGLNAGVVWSGKVIVEGKEVGEYTIRGGVITLMNTTNWVTSGTLKATHPTTGKVIDVFRYNSSWVPNKNVPSFENYQITITGTKGSTKYKIVRKMSHATVNEDTTTPLPLRMLTGEDLARMNAQYKAFETGFKALKAAKPITVDAINTRKDTVEDKNLALACKSFFDSYIQWPEGPFAEDILTMADNYNAVAWGVFLTAAVGKPAPSFRAPMEQKYWYNTKPIPYYALRGKVTIIEIFGPDCYPCRLNVPHLNALYDKFGKQGLMIISVTNYGYAAVHKNKKIRNTIEDIVNGTTTRRDGTKIEGARYPILGDYPSFKVFDENGDPMWSKNRNAQALMVQVSYNFQPEEGKGIPHAIIIDRNGMVVWRGHPALIANPAIKNDPRVFTEEDLKRLLKDEEKKEGPEDSDK